MCTDTQPITDFHTHAFPDAIADRAMAALLAETENVTAWRDGRIASLLASMDKAGIDRAVVCSIATKPAQYEKILAWSEQIQSPRIIPFPSVHPGDPDLRAHAREIAARGFKGIKVHPYYQDFDLTDDQVIPLYEEVLDAGLLLVSHTGFDIAFPRIRRCDPVRIRQVLDRFPGLRFVATHLGAWEDWDEVDKHLAGQPIYMEISYSLNILPADYARKLIMKHPADHVLFGSDSPWTDQAQSLEEFRALNLGSTREQAILGANATKLLGPHGTG